MIIGLVPGAMKPYHTGHHFLVKQALTECHKVIILTTIKDRKGISGKNMRRAWEYLILPLLDIRVEVQFILSPVGSVYNILEDEEISPTDHVYRVYGGTEDINRFPTKYIQSKFPISCNRFINVAMNQGEQYLRGIGKSPKAKGEWVRKAIGHGDLETFRTYLPSFLKQRDKEYLSILRLSNH